MDTVSMPLGRWSAFRVGPAFAMTTAFAPLTAMSSAIATVDLAIIAVSYSFC